MKFSFCLRRSRALAVAASLVLGVFSLQRSAHSQAAPETPRTVVVQGHEAIDGDVLVSFRRAIDAREHANLIQEIDADQSQPLGFANLRRLHSRRFPVDILMAYLQTKAIVAYAEPNFVLRSNAVPNDSQFPSLWNLSNVGQNVIGQVGLVGADIHAAAAWDLSTGSRANVVGVVDTGIDYTHPDLAANVWSAPAAFTVVIGGVTIQCAAGTHGYNALTQKCDPKDDNGHGTHVSGTIGAVGNNGTGVAGVNWTASLMGLKFLDSTGGGSVAGAIDAIEFAVQAKAAFGGTQGANVRVLSNSWGGGTFSQALLNEITRANTNDMLFVAAAGNSGTNNDTAPFYPANYAVPNVMSVAATDNGDAIAAFSNRGSSVSIAAPGVNIYSTLMGAGYGYLSGTSMATPHVSGAAALILSKCTLTTAALKANLLANVDVLGSLSGLVGSSGRLNVDKALRACAPSQVPNAPAGLAAAAGEAQVLLSWNASGGATSYKVKRATVSGGPYATVATGVAGTTFTDAAVVNATTYYYVVTAVNATGESGNSNQASAIPGRTVAVVAGTPQSTAIGTPFAVALQASVRDAFNAPVSGAQVTFTSPAGGASATFGGLLAATAVTNAAGVATSLVPVANAVAGAYTVLASVSGAPAVSFNLTNTASGIAGMLTGASTSATATVDLTAEGTADWIHWGDAVLNRKATAAQLGTYTPVGGANPSRYPDDLRSVTWTDGAPTAASGANAAGLYIAGSGRGFSFTAPADAIARSLVVHVGGWSSSGTFTAHLSDGSAPDFVDTTTFNGGQYDRNYTLTYSARVPGQTLTITWVMATGAGNVTLNAAALALAPSSAPPSMTASAGTPQTATVNTAFGSALQVTVLGGNGQPMAGATVTFTAPAAGASAAFAGSATAAAVTNAGGVASVAAPTANGTAGAYNITATLNGYTIPAVTLALTNAAAPTMTATAGASQSTFVNTPFGSGLQVTVLNGNGQPLSGATVTFAAPAAGASASFAGGAIASAVTNASGVVSIAAPTANGIAGSYNVTATLNGYTIPAVSFPLTNVGQPTMTVTSGTPQSALVSTAFGSPLKVTVLDGSGQPFSGATVTFTAPAAGAGATFGGATVASATTDANGVASVAAVANGTTGNYAVTAVLTGYTIPAVSFALSNLGLPTMSVTSGTPQSTTVGTPFGSTLKVTVLDGAGRPLTGAGVTFTAPAAGAGATFGGATTMVAVTDAAGVATTGAVAANLVAGAYMVTASLNGYATTPVAFALTNLAVALPPTITITGGTPQTTAVNTAFAAALQVTVRNGSGQPMPGASVTFAAPAVGASAMFGGASMFGVITDANGVATAPAPTANSVAGVYAVTATLVGSAVPPVQFALTNTSAAVQGQLIGAVSTSSLAVNLTAEGSADWIHWGDTVLNRKAGAALISNYSMVGTTVATSYPDDLRAVSWADGAPTAASAGNKAGLYVAGAGRGFTITAPADTTSRTLVVHVGGWASAGKLVAHLSDGSSVDFVNTTTIAVGQYDRNYTLTYSAQSAGQTLRVTWTMVSGGGNVTLNAAALSVP